MLLELRVLFIIFIRSNGSLDVEKKIAYLSLSAKPPMWSILSNVSQIKPDQDKVTEMKQSEPKGT